MNQLLQMLSVPSVAIVGNGPVTRDFSAEIDAADVVVRFNHFYRLSEGRTGRKTNVVIQTFTDAWVQAADKHIDVLNEFDATIFIGKKPQHYNTSIHNAISTERPVINLARLFQPWERFTTGGAFLCYLASVRGQLPETRFSIYGFDGGEGWKSYIATDARHYASVADEERAAVDTAKAMIVAANREPRTASHEPPAIPLRIVVPVKANSEGAPGKNRALLPLLLEKLKGREPITTIVGDDTDLLHAAHEAGFDICAMPHIDAYADITDTLRHWRAVTGYCGYVALVQATTPGFTVEWLERVAAELKHHPLVATACEYREKFTAIYYESSGMFVPLGGTVAPTSRARQLLPKAVRLNGGVFGFHSDALDFPSLFECGFMKPVVVPEAESLDVDTREDLAKALKKGG